MTDRPAILCCPDCKGERELNARIVRPGGRTKSGVLFCRRCQDVVGAVRNSKYDFLHFDEAACWERLKRAPGVGSLFSRLPFEVTEEVLAFEDPRLKWRREWEPWENKYKLTHGQREDKVCFSGEFLDVSVRLVKHPWSGRARFLVDREVVGEVDLYQEKWSKIHRFPIIEDLPPGQHTVSIAATGEKSGSRRQPGPLLGAYREPPCGAGHRPAVAIGDQPRAAGIS